MHSARCKPPRPIRDPIVSFSHPFSPKSTHIGGRHPPQVGRPPLGNLGSATDNINRRFSKLVYSSLFGHASIQEQPSLNQRGGSAHDLFSGSSFIHKEKIIRPL